MQKHFHNLVLGVSVLPALLVMPAFATSTPVFIPDAGDWGTQEVKNYVAVDDWDDTVVFINKAGVIVGENSVFENNKSGLGGAISIAKKIGQVEIKSGTRFEGNTAVYDGGAIGNYGSAIVGDNVSFINNKSNTKADGSQLASDSQPIGGGAISMGVNGSLDISHSLFSGNETGYNGGAIGTRRTLQASEATEEGFANLGNLLKIGEGTVFTQNKALGYTADTANGKKVGGNGGAIANTFATAGITGATFDQNSAVNNGGAIYNTRFINADATGTDSGKGGVMTVAGSVFTGNTAAKGGAIYNAGDLMLAGVNKFEGNKAANIANDIHNLGTLNIVSGTTSIDGGITGDGALAIAEGATLNIGTAAITQSSLLLNGTLNATLLNANKFASLDVTEITESATGSLNLALKGVGDYEVFKKDKDVVDSANIVLDYDKNLFVTDWNADGNIITVSMKPVEEIAANTGLKGETAAAVSHIAEAAAKSGSALMQDLSLKLQDKLASGDTASVEHVSQAINPEQKSVSQSVSSSVQNAVVGLASARMASPSVGRNGGDVELTAGGVWAQGLFNKSKQADAFNGYTRGIAMGMDGTINKDWTVGAGYSFAHSDISGTARNTEIDSNTVFVYGQYKPAEWYVNAIANYTMSDYSERGTILDGAVVTGDYDVDSFGGALTAGYDFANGITPELGLRYMHVNANDYANSYGIKTHMDDTDFLTGVVGAKYAFNIAASDHMTFAPQLSAAMKYDMLSDKNVATVTMPGLDAYTLDGSHLNRIGGEFGIGLGMQYRELEVSVNYDVDVREDYTSQTGMLKFRYNF